MKQETVTIKVATDFGLEPYGRFPEHGEFSGQRFRHEFLLPALSKGHQVLVEMAGAVGYGSSFLEESFGGLVRLGYFTAEQLKKNLVVRHPLQLNVDRVWQYIGSAVYEADKDQRGLLDARYKNQQAAAKP